MSGIDFQNIKNGANTKKFQFHRNKTFKNSEAPQNTELLQSISKNIEIISKESELNKNAIGTGMMKKKTPAY